MSPPLATRAGVGAGVNNLWRSSSSSSSSPPHVGHREVSDTTQRGKSIASSLCAWQHGDTAERPMLVMGDLMKEGDEEKNFVRCSSLIVHEFWNNSNFEKISSKNQTKKIFDVHDRNMVFLFRSIFLKRYQEIKSIQGFWRFVLFSWRYQVWSNAMQLCSLVTAPHYYRLHICIFNCYVVLVAAPGSGQITIAAIAATLRGPVTT